MNVKKWRTVLLIALAAVIVGVCGGIRLYRTLARDEATDGKLTVHFIDVGQGDASLLTFPDGSTAMIDTGTAESAEDVIAYLRRWAVEEIDFIFLSHGHSDHAGGLQALCGAFEVNEICYMGQAPTVGVEAHEQSPALRALTAGSRLEIGGVTVDVLAPLTEQAEENDNSMILRLSYGETVFLFTGDAEEGEEKALLAACPELLDADVLKVAHHGSANSSTEAFLQAVTPQVAVISASADNSFGHPAPSVIARLEAMGCTVCSTHEAGSVTLVCDGKRVVRRTGDDYLALHDGMMKDGGKDKKKMLDEFVKFQKNACIFLLNTV